MPIDDRMFGKLRDVKPLTEPERKQLAAQMKTERDRAEFSRIVVDHATRAAPQQDDFGRDLVAGAQAVWEFGNELTRRLEARELRRLGERVRQRDQRQHHHVRQR